MNTNFELLQFYIYKKLVKRKDAQAYLEDAARLGLGIRDYLIHKEIITDSSDLAALAEYYCMPGVEIDMLEIDKELFELTKHAFYLFSVAFLLSGLNIFASTLFTALNNGLISAIISFLRTLVFQAIAVLVLPEIIGEDGIWYSIAIAEVAAFVISSLFVVAYRKKYHYWPQKANL